MFKIQIYVRWKVKGQKKLNEYKNGEKRRNGGEKTQKERKKMEEKVFFFLVEKEKSFG